MFVHCTSFIVWDIRLSSQLPYSFLTRCIPSISMLSFAKPSSRNSHAVPTLAPVSIFESFSSLGRGHGFDLGDAVPFLALPHLSSFRGHSCMAVGDTVPPRRLHRNIRIFATARPLRLLISRAIVLRWLLPNFSNIPNILGRPCKILHSFDKKGYRD